MFRRSIVAMMGAPPRKRKPGPPVIHLSMRPEAADDIDFNSLGLQFPVTHPTTFTHDHISWGPKPATTPNLPFVVERTEVGQSLPVYTDYKGSGTKVITLLRKIKGDIPSLKKDLEKVVGQEVAVRPGRLEVSGNYVRRVKRWLTGLGF